MRKGITTFALAVGLGAGGAAVLTPALASAQDSGTPSSSGSTTSTATSRVDRIQQALRSLVTDGTITQEQADEVATTLADRLPVAAAPTATARTPAGWRPRPWRARWA